MASRSLERGSPSTRFDLPAISFGLVVVAVALLPLVHRMPIRLAGGVGNTIVLKLYDLPLLVLVVLTLADAAERRAHALDPRRWSLPTILLTATLAWMALAAVAKPTWHALDAALGIAAAWAIVSTIHRAGARRQTRFLAAVVAFGMFEAVLGLLQSLTADQVGLGWVEEPIPLEQYGTLGAAVGSLVHRNSLAAVIVMGSAAAFVLTERLTRAKDRWALGLAVLVLSVTLPLTFSRTVLLALVPVIAIAMLARPAGRALVVPVVLGLAIGGLIGQDGVSTRFEDTASAQTVDSGRRGLVADAVEVSLDNPLFGVGHGKLIPALEELGQERPIRPHNIAVQVAAESGIIAGALVASLLLILVLWAARRGALALIVVFPLLTFVLLHTYPYTFDMPVVGLWVAILAVAGCVGTGRTGADDESGTEPSTTVGSPLELKSG